MTDQETVVERPPEIEAESMSEAEAKALREECRGLSLDELHLAMSNVMRRARRGHLSQQRAGFLLWGYRQVKDVAEAVDARDHRLAELRELRRLQELVAQANRSGVPALGFGDPDISVPLNGHDIEVQS